jgi:8-oxo-dGTP pyrophosphatase MutT (NUDIX family)
MRSTKIVTSFITSNKKFLLLKRSENVKSMKCLWGGISGIIEKYEMPLERAKIEIFEEVGIKENKIKLLKSGKKIQVSSPQYKNHEWEVFPFLFEADTPDIKLNWENSDFRWVLAEELKNYQAVPNLEKVFLSLL